MTRIRLTRPLRLAALAIALSAAPGIALAQGVEGIWRTEATEEGTLEIRLAPCAGNALCGTILRARDLQGREQPYPHTGRQMIWGMTPAGTGRWSDGRIWDPRNGRTFNSRMQAQGDALVVVGCVLGICQRQVWQRVR